MAPQLKISRRASEERGAALVEFALILPVFMMLVLGMFSGGLAYNQKLSLTQASREGARYGATIAADQSFVSGTWASNVKDLIIQRAAGELDPSTGAQVCVALVEGTSSPSPSTLTVVTTPTYSSKAHFTTNGTSPCNAVDTYTVTATDKGRRVQVLVTRPSHIELLVQRFNLTLTAKATARFEG